MLKISASSIGCFKACPYRFYLKYIKHIVPEDEKTSLRWGTNWHTILEVLSMKPGDVYEINDVKYQIADDPMLTAVGIMNDIYADKAGVKTPEELEVEKIQLLYMASAYRWYYADDQIQVTKCEQTFEIPIPNPKTGNNLRGVQLVGKIDKVGQRGNKTLIIEHKSTSKPIDSDSTYWSRLNLDTQTTLYPFVTKFLGEQINEVLYDVVHKPTIKPKKLSFADTKKFMETCEYCGQTFLIASPPGGEAGFMINGTIAEISPGKKEGDIAILETPEMYGARLLQDITERPTFYLARKAIARTDADLLRFNKELLCMVDTIRHMTKMDGWFHNEASCEATFRCDYIDMCYNNINPDTELPKGLMKNEKA